MTEKCCTKCNKVKPLSEFSKHDTCKDGIRTQCKSCHSLSNKKYYYSHQKEKKEYRKKYHQNHPEKRKQQWQEYTYGLKSEQRMQMYINQNGCCKICKKAIPYSKIVTDHDHIIDKVRGLLCYNCNFGMSFIDDAEFLENAIRYRDNG